MVRHSAISGGFEDPVESKKDIEEFRCIMSGEKSTPVKVNYPALYREMDRLQNTHWWFKVHYQAILDLVFPYIKTGMVFLDIGSAAGWSTAGLPPETSRILFDIRPLALKSIRSRAFACVCGDAHHLPFESDSCDVIVCEGLLHQCEVYDPRRIAREAVRVCRPGGLIVLAEPAFSCLYGKHDEVFGGCRRFTTRDLLALFSGQSVKCVRKTYLHLFAFLPLWIIRKTSRRVATDFSWENAVTNTISLWLGTVERWLSKRISLPFGVTAAVLMRRDPTD